MLGTTFIRLLLVRIIEGADAWPPYLHKSRTRKAGKQTTFLAHERIDLVWHLLVIKWDDAFQQAR